MLVHCVRVGFLASSMALASVEPLFPVCPVFSGSPKGSPHRNELVLKSLLLRMYVKAHEIVRHYCLPGSETIYLVAKGLQNENG